ncbi:MAG: tetratricopeptide repeat protein [Sediminibacterium sp.]
MKKSVLLLIAIFLVNSVFSQSTSVDYFNKGNSLMQVKDLEGAVFNFTTAIKLDPNYEMAYVNRALCRMAKGKWASAIPDCNKALEINPNQAVAYFIRGCAKANTKKNGCSDLYKSLDLGYSFSQNAISKFCK